MKSLSQKSQLFIAFIFAVFSQASNAVDCLPLNTTINLNTQTLVDDFYTDHGVCDTVVGGLTIEGSDITDLSNLSSLTSVSEKLTLLSLESLISFTGLSNMTSVGALEIDGNDSLVDFSLLSNLQQVVSGDIIIVENNNMISLAGLENLQEMNPNNKIFLFGNNKLASLSTLSNLQIGLTDVVIRHNNKLTNLTGLSGLQGDISGLVVDDNSLLSSLSGLGSITNALNTIKISKNTSLTDISVLSSIITMDGNIELLNLAIPDVNALSNLTFLEGNLNIEFNAFLTNLNGLSNLQGIASGIEVTNNPMLRNCSGISRLVDGVDDYDVGPGAGAIPDVADAIILSGNLSSCNSIQNIIDFKILYVDENSPANSVACAIGECWDNAFSNVQDALAIVVFGEIWVAAGVYYPDVGGSQVDGDESATFTLIDGVSVYGGFNGTETTINQRNPALNITVLSGDIDGDDANVDGNFISETFDEINGLNNSYHIIFGSNVDTNTIIDGFTVSAGFAGAGTPNSLKRGAGMYCGNDTTGPKINQMVFIANKSLDHGSALYGCSQNIQKTSFINNKAEGHGIIYAIGGYFNQLKFEGNKSNKSGGAIRNQIALLTINNTKFINNASIFDGGALFSSANIVLDNVLFSGNYTANDGAGFIINGNTNSATLTNVTLTGNWSNGSGGAIKMFNDASLNIRNSIIWNNRENTNTGTASASIANPGTGIINNSYSLIQGFGTSGVGNLDQDPLYISDTDPSTAPTNAGNAHLNIGSLAINQGDNSIVTSTTDLDGNTRIQNTTVDMGAYESSSNTVSVTVSGLNGTVILQNNGIDDLTFNAIGTQAFSTAIANTADYLVTVLTQPTSPNQNCVVTNGTGTINGADVSVDVACTTTQYNVGVVVSGLANGTIEFDNNGEGLTVSANGQFNFASFVDVGSSYDVSIVSQPVAPNQICVVTNGSGIIAGADVLLDVICKDVILVDASAAPLGDGLSWNTAYNNLQDALANPNVAQIWVATGVYYPDIGQNQVDNNPSHSFDLSSGISVLGGFAGNETDASQRDPANNLVVLSADIDNNDANIDGNNITENTDDIVGLNAYHVLTLSGDDNLIDGLTITAGYAFVNSRGGSNDPRTIGGGISCNYKIINIEGVNFSGNLAKKYGGALNNCPQAIINNSQFNNNTSLNNGGAIYQASNAIINNTQFINNSAISFAAGFFGSGTMTDVLFEGNSANIGAAISSNGSLNVNRGKFLNNSAFSSGGAIRASKALRIENSLFSGNISGGNGGAINSYTNGDLVIINSTITGNNAVNGGGIYSAITDQTTISNSIVWNNKDTSGTGTIAANLTFSRNTPTTSYSIIQGSGGSSSWDLAAGTDGGDNLDQDPLFIIDTDPSTAPTSAGNTHLNIGSPAINQGDNSVVTSTTDLDGNTRIQNTTVDMGAYEFSSHTVSVTVTGLDGTVVLQNNGIDDLTFNAIGTQAFSTAIANTADYLVTVLTQPTSPNQNCVVTNGTGTINNVNVSVDVACTTTQYNVGVDVLDLANGNSVILDNNGESLTVNIDGQFNFATPLDDGNAYDVTVTTQPTTPNQICSVVAGSGTLQGMDVLLTVTCTTNQYFVGGIASGIVNGNSVTLSLGAEDLNVNSNAAFVFLNPLTDKSSYSVSVTNQPTVPNQTCGLVNPTGTIAGNDITDIEVNCTTNEYLIGGFVTGLHSGNNLIVQNNNDDDLTISSSGNFDFVTAIDDLLGYDVSILNQPTNPIQPCVVSNNTGNVAGTAVTTVSIVCEFGDDLIYKNDFEQNLIP